MGKTNKDNHDSWGRNANRRPQETEKRKNNKNIDIYGDDDLDFDFDGEDDNKPSSPKSPGRR